MPAAFSSAFQRNAFQRLAFQIEFPGGDGDGPAGGSKRRRRYRYNEKLTPEQAVALRQKLDELRRRQEAHEEAQAERELAALQAELEAQILAMLMAWPEEQEPVLPPPYQAPLPLIQAFGYGQHVSDQERMAEIVRQMEMVAQEMAAEQQRLREQDDEEAMMLLQ